MTSITPDELRERLEEIVERLRAGETFAIVADDAVIAGLLPVARLRLDVDRHRDAVASDVRSETPTDRTRPKRPTADEETLERLREEHESTHD